MLDTHSAMKEEKRKLFFTYFVRIYLFFACETLDPSLICKQRLVMKQKNKETASQKLSDFSGLKETLRVARYQILFEMVCHEDEFLKRKLKGKKREQAHK